MTKIFAELSDDAQRIEVWFPYDPAVVRAVKTITGYRFVPREKSYNERPHWTVPLDMEVGRELRRLFSRNLVLGDNLMAWGREERKASDNLRALAAADDWPLDDMALLKHHPEMANWLRRYQRADVKFMANASVVNALEMSLGKTAESIAATIEAGLHEAGGKLVIAPKTALETVWGEEINRWLPNDRVFCWSGEVKQKDRPAMIAAMQEYAANSHPWWLVTTPDMLRRGLPAEPASGEWEIVIIDEYHKHGLTNMSGKSGSGTAFAKAAKRLKAKRKWPLSGTPLRGKVIKLWGALHWMFPDKFPSKWRWADQWLEVTDNGFGKDIGGIKSGKEDDFYKAHAPYLIRRLKYEVMPQLPRKIYKNVWCKMSAKQAKQYEEFARDAEIRIEEEKLTAIGVLAEYTRLKQFANAHSRIERRRDDSIRVVPDGDSCKLEPLLENLAEQGITADDYKVPGELALIGSESREFVEWLADQLRQRGLKVETMTGHTKQEDRTRIQRESRDPATRAQVIVMTTQTGGVSINLEPANSVHVMDETWVPDDQDQLIERADRGSRTTPLAVFYYRTRATVQEYIYETNQDKALTNKQVLDLHRKLYKEAVK